jgi:hypothetical protein
LQKDLKPYSKTERKELKSNIFVVVFRLFSGTDKVRLMADATMSVVRQLKKPLRHAHSTDDFLLVFRICELLVRIRILGSVLLNNGSGSVLESCSFRAYKKKFNTKFVAKNFKFKSEDNVPAGKLKEKNMKKMF